MSVIFTSVETLVGRSSREDQHHPHSVSAGQGAALTHWQWSDGAAAGWAKALGVVQRRRDYLCLRFLQGCWSLVIGSVR